MTGVPSARIAVDLDLAFEGREKRCDFILFIVDRGALVVAPMELKSGRFRVPATAEQLRQGARFADSLAPAQAATACRPVLIHGRSIHPQQRTLLNRAKIEFRGRKLTVKTARCDRPRNLAHALQGAAPDSA